MRSHVICLCMIVKDEAAVIRRCLESVRSFVDHWVIVDTGSTDGTQDIIRELLADLPGELHERPWRDFAHNRMEALALARPHGDYSLLIDADDTLEIPEGFERPELIADAYVVDIFDAHVRFPRIHLVRNALPWRYRGVLHEFLTCEGAGPAGHLPLAMYCNRDGARRRDPAIYRKDAAILEGALATETDPFMVARYTFYLAQSYRDCGETAKAVETYLRRAAMDYRDQEAYYSLYFAAQLADELGHRSEDILELYLRASDAAPDHGEALYRASRLCRKAGWYRKAYEIAKRGASLAMPTDSLLVEPWIYEYGLLDELAVNAYSVGSYAESLDTCLRMLASGRLPPSMVSAVAANARCAADKRPHYHAWSVSIGMERTSSAETATCGAPIPVRRHPRARIPGR